MVKRAVLALVAVFVLWSILDIVLHGILLSPIYAETKELWRPVDEMNRPMMTAVTLVHAACFVAIYWLLVGKKSLGAGLAFGVIFGIGAGFPMGFGLYGVMPIPLTLAASWFSGTLVEAILAGAIVGAVVKPPKAVAAT